MNNSAEILFKKIDTFRKKYYLNKIIRGSILAVVVYCSLTIIISVLEYFGKFSIMIRSILFYSLIITYLYILIAYIIYPVLKYYKIGKIINKNQAANLISKHFKNIQDKLLNTIELIEIEKSENYSKELLLASIEKRTYELKPIPFIKAVNFKKNNEYLKLLLIVILVGTAIFILSPNIITEGAERIVNHNQYFKPKNYFDINILNKELTVEKGKDFMLNINVEGNVLPDNLFIDYGGNEFIMKKIEVNKFSYRIKNINNDMDFYIKNEKYISELYKIKVLKTPVILDFIVKICYPDYIERKNEILKNIGNLKVPEGSIIEWEFNTIDTDTVILTFDDNHVIASESNKNDFKRIIKKTCSYEISLINKNFYKKDIIKYNISCSPDLYPSINVAIDIDSKTKSLYYFYGIIEDDYGFNKLEFNYYKNDSINNKEKLEITINKNITVQEIFYVIDFKDIIKNSNADINYYFEVWDNDYINGFKSTRSKTYQFIIPEKDELKRYEEKENSLIKEKIEKGILIAQELKRDISELKKNLVNNEYSNWEKKNIIENIVKKQNYLEDLINEINKTNKEKNNYLNSFTEQQENIIRKNKEIAELFEKLMNEEIKKLFEELKELMNSKDEIDLKKIPENMQLSYEEVEKQLERNLEILKKYEIEKNVYDLIDRLNELSEEQKILSEENKKEKSTDELVEMQEKSNEEFKKIEEEYKNTLKKNEELEKKFKLDDYKEDFEKINDEFEEGKENLQNNKKNKASNSQSKNSKNLKRMANSMKSMMDSNFSEQNYENIDDLRQILDNLIIFSFDQEELIEKLKITNTKDPKYQQIIKKQLEINDNFIIIEDSLNSLAKREEKISSIIEKELFKIKSEIPKTIKKLDERKTGQARSSQQFTMTYANNLALLLAEILESMENMMGGGGADGKKCNKPKKSGPSIGKMREGQENLKEQLESMIKQMKNGKGKNNGGKINQQLADMIKQQEMFQKLLQELINNSGINSDISKNLSKLNDIIEKNKRDISNKNINRNTIERQKMIVTRLLEAEKAEMEREIEKKRKSVENKKEYLRNTNKIFEYKKEMTNFDEILDINKMMLKEFYRNKYREYILKLNKE